MRLILINALIGLLVAVIAQGKGYPFIPWWVKGAISGPFGLLYVIFMKRQEPPKNEEKNASACPNCGGMISLGQSLCPHCRNKIDIVDV